MSIRTEILRLASWRASRTGMTAELVDRSLARPAFDVVDALCAYVR